MSKNKKIPSQLAKNASKLHRRIGELLTSEDSLYKNYLIRQEVRVSEVNPEFSSNREKFDWIILDPINIVIEVHGEQHYRPVTFGGISEEQANKIFLEQQDRDYLKKQAAIDAGWGYIAISYKQKDITLDELTVLIQEAISNRKEITEVDIKEKPKQKIESKPTSWPKRKLETSNKLQSKPFPKLKHKIWNPPKEKSK